MAMVSNKHRCVTFFHNLLTNPKKLVRLVVLLICTIVVVFQVSIFLFAHCNNFLWLLGVTNRTNVILSKLTDCFMKLRHPPITTHSRYELNETISYPALTFCRDPPYKRDVMKVIFLFPLKSYG